MATMHPSSGIATVDGDRMKSRSTRPTILVVGWVSLFMGLSVPFAVSVAAVRLFWNLPCLEGVQWSFAPLVVACEPVGALRSGLGWSATIVCVTALTIATVIAVVSILRWVRTSSKRDAMPSLLFTTTVGGVAAITGVVIAINPDAATHSRGAWITLSSFAAFGSATVLAVASMIFWSAASARANRSSPTRP